ncbi:MAG: glycosyltransferase family 2 protein [Candidatus Omnitrophica bacterium]|nr:glycosyltransferase family 2 protein [Candidatus Omnitrophota bacterium]
MISIVIPVHNEERNLAALQQEVRDAMSGAGPYETVYVNDGSTDGSLKVLDEIRSRYPEVKVVELSRHFGQTEAMQAGIDHAKGDILVFLDADLQNDPRDIPRLLSKIAEGYDVVSGWRKGRRDPCLTRKIPSLIANFLISRISKVKLHDLGCTLKAYRKEALEDIRLYSEMHRLIPLYVARQGGKIAEIEVSHRKRAAGRSKYGLTRFFRVVLDFYVAEFMNGFLNKPMYVFGGWGIFLTFLAGCLGAFILMRKVLWGGEWVSPLFFILVMLVIVSVQLILMGLIAEIVIRIYYENRQKKTYSVKRPR